MTAPPRTQKAASWRKKGRGCALHSHLPGCARRESMAAVPSRLAWLHTTSLPFSSKPFLQPYNRKVVVLQKGKAGVCKVGPMGISQRRYCWRVSSRFLCVGSPRVMRYLSGVNPAWQMCNTWRTLVAAHPLFSPSVTHTPDASEGRKQVCFGKCGWREKRLCGVHLWVGQWAWSLRCSLLTVKRKGLRQKICSWCCESTEEITVLKTLYRPFPLVLGYGIESILQGIPHSKQYPPTLYTLQIKPVPLLAINFFFADDPSAASNHYACIHVQRGGGRRCGSSVLLLWDQLKLCLQTYVIWRVVRAR